MHFSPLRSRLALVLQSSTVPIRAVALLLLLASAGLAAPVVLDDAGRAPRADYAPGEVVVLLSADANGNGRLDAGESLDGLARTLPGTLRGRTALAKGFEVLRIVLPAGVSLEEATSTWAGRDPRIAAVEPNAIYRALAVPDDPRFAEQWPLHNTGQSGGKRDADIDAPEAWDLTTGAQNAIVAVIDSGMDTGHPDLAPNLWINSGETPGNGVDDDGNGYVDDVHGYDFWDDDATPDDLRAHGTHVAGIVGARGNDGTGVAGTSWRCRLMAVRFLNQNGEGYLSDAVDAIRYAADNGARVINASWGNRGEPSATMQAALSYARDRGVLFVAAAGNSASDNDGAYPTWPASYPHDNILSVAATDHRDYLAWFSCFGKTSVDVAAPGVGVLSTIPSDQVLWQEDFQSASAPPAFAGTAFSSYGPNNHWGVVLSDLGGAENLAARADWDHGQPYASFADGYLESPALDTRGLRGVKIAFDLRLECYYDSYRNVGDYLAVELSRGAGWEEVYAVAGAGLWNLGRYLPQVVEIPDRLRGAATRFRFRWVTDDAYNNFHGAELDNVRVLHQGGDYAQAYQAFNGTSMAAPHAAGAAALLLARSPAMHYSEVRNRLIASGDPQLRLIDRTISAKRLNAHQALRIGAGLTVLSPNGGERLALGTLQTIGWASLGGGSQVTITLLRNGSAVRTIASGVPNTGYALWHVGDTLAEGGGYAIRVQSDAAVDYSDGTFELVRAAATMLVRQDFEQGLGLFEVDNTNPCCGIAKADGLWHVSTGRGNDPGHSPAHSVYFGREEGPAGGGNYNGGEVEGVVRSPVMDLAGVEPPVTLSFNYFLETEGRAPQFDEAAVEVRSVNDEGTPAGEWDRLVDNIEASQWLVDPSGGWRTMALDLSAYAGLLVQFQFHFETWDSNDNYYEGWYVDDVALSGVVPGPLAPVAHDRAATACDGEPVEVRLIGSDYNGDALTYVIRSLPEHGALHDPRGGAIEELPYGLLDDGDVVVYRSDDGFDGLDGFVYGAFDGSSHSPDATVRVTVSAPPDAPDDPQPADGAAGVAPDAAFAWTPSAARSCDVRYAVYFGRADPPLDRIAEDLMNPQCDVGVLDNNATYYWQVVASDCCGSVPGPVWSFRTASLAPGRIEGTVRIRYTETPLAGVTLRTDSGCHWATSDANGDYAMAGITPGRYTVTASKEGYKTVRSFTIEVGPGQTKNQGFGLERWVPELENGAFEGEFYERPDADHRVANGWDRFALAGNMPKFGPVSHVYRSPATAQAFWENGYNAGILQQVSGTVSGRDYTFSVWVRGDNGVLFRIGIDPTAGTIPYDGDVLWSNEVASDNVWTRLEKTVTAREEGITVFVKVTNPYGDNRNGYIDDAQLVETQLPRADIGVWPATLHNTATWGGSAPSQTFSVWNTGDAPLRYTVCEDADWLWLAPLGGTSSDAGDVDTVAVHYEAVGLGPGVHRATVRVVDEAARTIMRPVEVVLDVMPGETLPTDTPTNTPSRTPSPTPTFTGPTWTPSATPTLTAPCSGHTECFHSSGWAGSTYRGGVANWYIVPGGETGYVQRLELGWYSGSGIRAAQYGIAPGYRYRFVVRQRADYLGTGEFTMRTGFRQGAHLAGDYLANTALWTPIAPDWSNASHDWGTFAAEFTANQSTVTFAVWAQGKNVNAEWDWMDLTSLDGPTWTPTATPAPPTPTATATLLAADTDGDAIPDVLEGNPPAAGQTNRWLRDSDGDGLADGDEDANRNGMFDGEETSARLADTDGDRYEDGVERFLRTDPKNPADPPQALVDADADLWPYFADISDQDPDVDDDRYLDGYEVVTVGPEGMMGPAIRPPLGDVNADGAVSNVDALAVQSLFLGTIGPGAPVFAGGTFSHSDANRDGAVSNVDALILQAYFLGRKAWLP